RGLRDGARHHARAHGAAPIAAAASASHAGADGKGRAARLCLCRSRRVPLPLCRRPEQLPVFPAARRATAHRRRADDRGDDEPERRAQLGPVDATAGSDRPRAWPPLIAACLWVLQGGRRLILCARLGVEAHDLLDELMGVSERVGVVLLGRALMLMLDEYLLQPLE